MCKVFTPRCSFLSASGELSQAGLMSKDGCLLSQGRSCPGGMEMQTRAQLCLKGPRHHHDHVCSYSQAVRGACLLLRRGV